MTPAFKSSLIEISGASQYVRTDGWGPAVLMLHGFGDTGDMWQPLADVLVTDHTVIVPDLRGMGLSTHPRKATRRRIRRATLRRSSIG